MYLKSDDVIKHMIATGSQWPELRSWLNQRKNKPAPMSLADIANDGALEFALYSARALPADSEIVGRRLALAFAVGSDGHLEELVSSTPRIGTSYSKLKEGILSHANGDASLENLRHLRWSFALLSEKAAKGYRMIACDALIAAAAPYAWGGASVAHRRALDAVKAINRSSDPVAAVEREEEYHKALLEHVCAQYTDARAA